MAQGPKTRAVRAPPPGATVLATTALPAPGVQMMRLGLAAYGVQFHPEVDPGQIAWGTHEASGHLDPARSREAQAESAAYDAQYSRDGALPGMAPHPRQVEHQLAFGCLPAFQWWAPGEQPARRDP